MSEDSPETPRSLPETEAEKKTGALILHGGFGLVKILTTILSILLLIDYCYSVNLFISAIKIRGHIGYFINMVSNGDGEILPSFQAVPILFFFLINIGMTYCLFKCFDDTTNPQLNRMMFVFVLLGFTMIIIMFVIIICVLVHSNGEHESIHDGIVNAMNNYSNNLEYKTQIDMLQIEFQCCGSKKYDEWYTIRWIDSSLEETPEGTGPDESTPFSCCSMHSLFPCIHHNIESTGIAYQYTPEFNLSVSTRGCYDMIREKKREVGWHVVLNLLGCIFFESVTTILLRYIQTAHSMSFKFVGHREEYIFWLFGNGSKNSSKKTNKAKASPSFQQVNKTKKKEKK